MPSTTSPYVSPVTTAPASASAASAPSLVVAKVAAGLLALPALAAALLGGYLAAADLSDGTDDMYDGLGTFLGLVVVGCAVPLLGLCAAVVVSRNRIVVGVCSLLVAGAVGPVAVMAGSIGGPVSLLGALALVLGVAGLWTLVTPTRD